MNPRPSHSPKHDKMLTGVIAVAFYLCVLYFCSPCTLIKKKIKFSSYIRKFRMERLQSHIWLTASSYMGKPFLLYDFITAPLWISLYMRQIFFSFLSVYPIVPSAVKHWDKRVSASLRISSQCVNNTNTSSRNEKKFQIFRQIFLSIFLFSDTPSRNNIVLNNTIIRTKPF